MPAVSPDRISERKAGQATLEFPLKTEKRVSDRGTELAFVQSWNQTGLMSSRTQEPNGEGEEELGEGEWPLLFLLQLQRDT